MALSIRNAVSLLSHAPTALFPIALGLAGLGAGFRAAHESYNHAELYSAGTCLFSIALTVLSIDILLYIIKWFRDSNEVAADFSTATTANLLAPGFMAAMIIGGGLATTQSFGGPLWMLATLGHFFLLLQFVGKWLTQNYAPSDLNPTWFLPAAGIMTSAVTWPGYGPELLPAFAMATGASVWLMLLPLVFRRLVFEPILPPELRPTLFIVAAPFGLISGSLLTITPDIDPAIPAALASGGLFFILVLLSHPRFIGRAGVTLSWWSTTFPVAIIASVFLRLPPDTGAYIHYIGSGVLMLACLTTSLAILATIHAAWCTCLKTSPATKKSIAAMQGIEQSDP